MSMQLSTQQTAAVACLGRPTLVVAGAGSGKTRTLTAKIAHLVRQGMSPDRILAITFTNKAADEMKRRLEHQTGLPVDRFPWVRTFHSACYRLLRRHCGAAGLRTPLQIWSTYQQQRAIKEILENELNADKKYVGAVAAHISHAKNSGDPAAYITAHPHVARVRLEDAYQRYEKRLRACNAVDFDNILLLMRDILRDDAQVRRQCRGMFDYLLVDEYQDTNNLQEELTRLLQPEGNLFCVGDDWQAIYSFRGSNVEHFLAFARNYPDARIFRLEQNFRSADEIVQVANRLITHNDRRMPKRCFSATQGGQVSVHTFGDDAQEARWVARTIDVLKHSGVAPDAIAILFRTKFCSLPFEQQLRAFQIPYRMLGGRGFFERREIMDLNCYLTAAVFPRDDASFERVLNTPRRGIGAAMRKKINAMRDGDGLQGAVRRALRRKVLTPKVYRALTDLMELLAAIRPLRPDLALRRVLAHTAYEEYLHTICRGNPLDLTARRENIEQLLFTAAQKDTLEAYLEEAALVKEDRQADDDAPLRAVNLSTSHAAKGLEFEVVFVTACEENLFPHWRSLEEPAGLEEERRLMYVSVTRAARRLYVSAAACRRGQYAPRSRFVDEIEAALD